MATPRPSTPGLFFGALSAWALAALCGYLQAFSWGASRGVLLDLSLAPTAYPTPTQSWTFTIAASLVCAVVLIWIFRLQATRLGAGLGRGMVIGGAALLVAFYLVRLFLGAGQSLEMLAYWQRLAFFTTDSGAYLTSLIVLGLGLIYGLRVPPSSRLQDGPSKIDDHESPAAKGA